MGNENISTANHLYVVKYHAILNSGGSRISRRGAWTSTRVLFGENVCENENIESRRRGVRRARPLDLPILKVVERARGFQMDMGTSS